MPRGLQQAIEVIVIQHILQITTDMRQAGERQEGCRAVAACLLLPWRISSVCPQPDLQCKDMPRQHWMEGVKMHRLFERTQMEGVWHVLPW